MDSYGFPVADPITVSQNFLKNVQFRKTSKPKFKAKKNISKNFYFGLCEVILHYELALTSKKKNQVKLKTDSLWSYLKVFTGIKTKKF